MEECSIPLLMPRWLSPAAATSGVPSYQLYLFILVIQVYQAEELDRTLPFFRGDGNFDVLHFFRLAAMPISQRDAYFPGEMIGSWNS